MMKITSLTVLAGSLLLAACATPVNVAATGGSKADGIVEISYEYGELQQPIVDEQQALQAAQKRCKAWGYKNADPFDGGINTCVMGGGLGGCARMRTTLSYQCLSK